ncbi:DUF881 domain-containing protein [Kitasatospora sp. NBC_01560]|uniref:DUF881 domain-containing protein n=1 Tax=Kitasatospora sp. NBC_01560 TaxID=2975965 RepID=UPI0038644304
MERSESEPDARPGTTAEAAETEPAGGDATVPGQSAAPVAASEPDPEPEPEPESEPEPEPVSEAVVEPAESTGPEPEPVAAEPVVDVSVADVPAAAKLTKPAQSAKPEQEGPAATEAEQREADVTRVGEPTAAPAEHDPEHDPEAVPAEPARAEAAEPEAEEPSRPATDRGEGRRRLQAALWPPRLSRGQLVVAVLLFSLGLALAIQVRSTNDHHSQLRGARQEDLVRILDELDGRQQRLQQEKAELEQSLAKLENSSNQAKEAQEQTRKKVTELGVLAGTVKATGPGIVLTVDDPQGQVKADMLLDTLQELRAAGAEAIQINDVRVVVNTYFTDVSGGGVQIDGKKVSQPYRFTVVGNPQDLTPALNIPGGVVRTLESHQARATITQQQKVVVDALVEPKTPQYAKPAPK